MSGDTRLRVMTANLYAGGAEPDALEELLDRLRPDVVAAQELTPSTAEVLKRRFPHALLDPRLDSRGMGLAADLPATFDRIRLSYRDALVARLEAGTSPTVPIEVVNVHVLSPLTWPLWTTLAIRRRQVRELASQLASRPEAAQVLLGDLNATPIWPAYRRLARPFTDAAREGGAEGPTWGPARLGSRSLLRIDHILVSGMAVERVRRHHVKGSDHRALVADLVI